MIGLPLWKRSAIWSDINISSPYAYRIHCTDLRFTKCFEPIMSNIYTRYVLAKYMVLNNYLVQDLMLCFVGPKTKIK